MTTSPAAVAATTKATQRVSDPQREMLRGWGRTHTASCQVLRPTELGALSTTVADARGVILPRGAGCAYGDAATRRSGTVIDVSGLNRLVSLDDDRGIVVVEAGMTLGELVRILAPRGWTPPVLPGTPHVSVGGAVAADIHGKNHVGVGSFGRHVRWLVVVDDDGESRMLTPGRDHDLFWATVGGMGLTGIITTVALQLLPTGPGAASTMRQRAGDLGAVLDQLESIAMDQRSDPLLHSVAWLEGTAPRGVRGRGLVQTTRVPGRQVGPGTVGTRPVAGALRRPARAGHSLPGVGVVGRASIVLANRARWAVPTPRLPRTSSIPSALQPLRRGELWPALFGRQGLVQYQFVVPTTSAEVIGVALDVLAEHRTPPALSVLKRLGPADPGPLTFAMEGWTLALDLPARWPGLELALGDLDEVVAAAGGRVYLAKDSRLPAESLALMYPRLGEWQQARAVLDPRGAFGSDLSRRLRLDPRHVAS